MALVGQSGSGKTSCVSLLQRLYDCQASKNPNSPVKPSLQSEGFSRIPCIFSKKTPVSWEFFHKSGAVLNVCVCWIFLRQSFFVFSKLPLTVFHSAWPPLTGWCCKNRWCRCTLAGNQQNPWPSTILSTWWGQRAENVVFATKHGSGLSGRIFTLLEHVEVGNYHLGKEMKGGWSRTLLCLNHWRKGRDFKSCYAKSLESCFKTRISSKIWQT